MSQPTMSLPLRFLYCLLTIAGRLPLRLQQRIAAVLARGLRLLGTREVKVARANLALALPQRSSNERETLLRASLRHTLCTLLESCSIWTRPAASSLRWIDSVEGAELLEDAENAGRGVIIAAPHIGNWELLSLYLASRRPVSVVYRPPERRALEPLIRRVRSHPGVTPLRAEPAAVRKMLVLLREGGSLGILPDQRPKAGEGVLSPLFGIPALTMTLLPRLAQKTGARVVFGFAERLPAAAGFRIRLLPAPAELMDPDPLRSTAALNEGIERCIALAEEQYQWPYKRYPARDPTGRHRYKRERGVNGTHST